VKTYVFDASALFIFLQKKASAQKVGELFKEALRGRAEILMSAVNCGEVYGLILREHGSDRATAAMNAIYSLPIRLIDATSQKCLRAADMKIRHKLYYVDGFAAALAAEQKATLVTSDSDFRRLGNTVSILWLKN
jgi:predicted nucleic acid-binding protein